MAEWRGGHLGTIRWNSVGRILVGQDLGDIGKDRLALF